MNIKYIIKIKCLWIIDWMKELWKKIITDKVICVNKQDTLHLRIYYKNIKTKNLVMKNIIEVSHSVLKTSHEVYNISKLYCASKIILRGTNSK